MPLSRRVQPPGLCSARTPKKILGRTCTMKDKNDPKHKPTHVFDFSDASDISSIGKLVENEDSYEIFDPPFHSTAIYADDEVISDSSISSTPQRKKGKRSLDMSEIEAIESKSGASGAEKQPKKSKPLISDESENDKESNIRRKINTEKVIPQREAVQPTASSELPEKLAKSATPQQRGPQSGSAVGKTTRKRHQNMQKNKKLPHGKKKKSENKDSGTPDSVQIWCLKEKTISDITELDVVLSAFENMFLEYKQEVKSKVCQQVINKFHSSFKEELIKMIKQVQMVNVLKTKNIKLISDIDKKRQHLIEVQDELLRLEPQLKQLQIKYEALKERKSSLRSAAYFLSNLKELHQDYSYAQEEQPKVKETYDSSSLPALLFQARTLLGAESHLQNINYQLEKLLDQE